MFKEKNPTGKCITQADADTKANLITEGSGNHLHEDFTLFSSGRLIKKGEKKIESYHMFKDYF